jgi:hypothetical protein
MPACRSNDYPVLKKKYPKPLHSEARNHKDPSIMAIPTERLVAVVQHERPIAIYQPQ